MSSNQINNLNLPYKIDLTGLQPHYQPCPGNRMQVQTEYMLTSNTNLYIPRIFTGVTEEFIKAVFKKSNVGIVDYCDISAVKDKDTKKTLFMSAFVKLEKWTNLSAACEDFERLKLIRLHLSRQTGEYWMLLPNNNPLPRTHLNISQLTAATDRLFEETEQISEKANSFETIMRTRMAEMSSEMRLQENKIIALEYKLAILLQNSETNPSSSQPIMPRGYSYKEPSIPRQYLMGELYPEMFSPPSVHVVTKEEEEEDAKDNADLDAILEAHELKRTASVASVLERNYDAEVDALLDAPMPMTRGVTYSEPLRMPGLPLDMPPIPILPPMTRCTTFYDPERRVNPRGGLWKPIIEAFHDESSDISDEEANTVEPLSRMTSSASISATCNNDISHLFATPPRLTRSVSVSNYNEDDECVFSNRQSRGQTRSPILKALVASSKPLTLGEIVAENPARAIGSRDLCGNL